MRDITVIGAGPVGLSAAFWAGMRSAGVQIVDALPEIGGQLTALYPDKPIYDVPGQPAILARELVEQHRRQTLEQFDVPVHLETTAEAITHEEDHVVLHTSKGDLPTRAVIVAAGHGAMQPRTLGDLDLTPWEHRGVSYLPPLGESFANRTVVVVGGGDSACDTALALAQRGADVHLVHRRPRFRAHEATVERVLATPGIAVHTPCRVAAVHGNGSLTGVTLVSDPIGSESVVGCDAVVLQLGFKSSLGPLAGWGFAVDRGSVVVDAFMRTSLDRVWACGDVVASDAKLKLIATGYGEAAIAVASAVRSFRPDEQVQPGYSTNTGVPGAVAGTP